MTDQKREGVRDENTEGAGGDSSVVEMHRISKLSHHDAPIWVEGAPTVDY